MSFAQNYRVIRSKSEKPGGERNVLDYLIYRKLAAIVLMFLQHYRFSPNIITGLSIIFSIITAYFLFYSYQRPMLIAGVIAMNVSLILDTLDGQYSRLTDQQTEFGGWFDGISDCLKYIFIISGLSCGLYYFPYLESQWFAEYLDALGAHLEFVLIMGMVIIGNFFMIYYVHVSRYALSTNIGTVVKLRGTDRAYHFGIESTLYTVFTIVLLLNQSYWLLVLLVFSLPMLWLYPIYLIYKKQKSIA
ncbi:MAG: CDP-alcohol phosphatidyltransferase family protein [Gammaproteobacteria bacterium]|nr:CDP-alcohol phosphatidyltransferase family protein [Gammaproteobacteria bacterium]MDH3467293.1 CDP-alcohol phosphatidyltransferase family protein [Gammaproteobacteria bacterium]